MKQLLLLLAILFAFSVNAQCYSNVHTGADYSIVRKLDGTWWSVGANNWGQLGYGDIPSSQTLLHTTPGIDWLKLSAGLNHVLAIKANGTLWGWGSNQMGQIGQNESVNSSDLPVQIGTANNWAYVAAGYNYSIGIKTNGTLWAWGINYGNILGIGPGPDRYEPVQVGTATNWSKAWAGAGHVIALRSNGSVWGWGNPENGALGPMSAGDFSTPTALAIGTGWSDFSVGNSFTMGLKTNGTLWSWGSNLDGRLGHGVTGGIVFTPTQIQPGTNWDMISAGSDFGLARKTNGTLYSWGNNNNGQLGHGNYSSNAMPQQIGSADDWQAFSASSYHHVMAIRSGDSLWGWGVSIGIGSGSTASPQLLGCALGIRENEFYKIDIYPNPSVGIIKLPDFAVPDNNLQIFDITGKLMLMKDVDTTEIDVTSFSAGIYFVKLQTADQTFIGRFIKN